jgi:peptidoglycan/xylan/chitin deacetylase (PgdA/CDA1 family)
MTGTPPVPSSDPDGRSEPMMLRWDDWHVYASPRLGAPVDGRSLAEFATDTGGTVAVVEADDGELWIPFDADEAYRNYLDESWAAGTDQRRLSAGQLAAFYRVKRFVPRRLQLHARKLMIRSQGPPRFPRWPLDDGVERLLRLHGATRMRREGTRELAFRWFWPETHGSALILTHDVESEEGIRLAVEVADLEETLGFRSAFNFGAWYDVDPGVIRELTARGFEIGMHGIVHNRSLFSSREAFEAQLPQLRALADRLGAVGFRSPATHRVFPWLAELPVRYDGTIPHSDPYEPQPGGCCSLWPFLVGDVVELPYTLPQDHTLLTLLGHRTPTLWIDTAEEVSRRHGLIHCISHPDAGYLGDRDKRAIYAEFLRAMAGRSDVWHALPAEVAAWWRTRTEGIDNHVRAARLVAGGESPLDVQIEVPSPTRS